MRFDLEHDIDLAKSPPNCLALAEDSKKLVFLVVHPDLVGDSILVNDSDLYRPTCLVGGLGPL